MATDPQNEADDFGALFEASLQKKRRRVQPGERLSGTVIQVGEKRVMLDLGDGLDGMMEMSELIAGDGSRPDVKMGQTLEGYVVHADDRVVELGRSATRRGMGAAVLDGAARAGLPVEGTVTEVNKGGYVIEVGGARGFCPLGQMDIRRIDDPNTMIGKKLLFKVTEARGGRDPVLSRRAILEEEGARKAEQTRALLKEGARLRGTVVNIRDFGAFVDLGGIEGLVPASELSHGRSRPEDVVKVGQDVEVEVMRIEAGKDGKGERVSLSMRAVVPHPFESVLPQLEPGTVLVGRVTRIQPFGAFVELLPGVEGLLHVSAFGKRVNGPGDVVKTDQTIAVRVQEADAAQRRISLAYVTPEQLTENGWTLPAHVAASAPKAEPKAETKGKGGVIVRKSVEKPAADASPLAPVGLRVLGHLVIATPVAVSAEEALAGTTTGSGKSMVRMGDIFDVTVDRIEVFGVFVSWETGRGLVPAAELGGPRGHDLRKAYPVGTKFRATVIEIRGDGKLKLSRTATERAEEKAEADAYMQKSKPSGGGGKGFGTLGDLLKNKSGG